MNELEFSHITTRGGDRGESSLANGERRRKDDLYFETLGTLDELVSYIGLVRSRSDGKMDEVLLAVQKKLQKASGVVALGRGSGKADPAAGIGDTDVKELEKEEHRLMQSVSIPGEFVRPGESELSAHTHVARTICRRAERRVVTCIRDRGLSSLIPVQRYLNRLADFLFVLAFWQDRHPKR